MSYSSVMDDQSTAGVSRSQRQDGGGAVCLPARQAPYNSAALVILAASLPILVSGGIFFVDGPNHLFRVALWEAMWAGDVGDQFFHVGEDLYPNLAIDVVAGTLSKVVPPAVALTLFICLGVGLYIFTAIWWRQQRGQRTDLPLLLIILLAAYSEPLYWGLFNYILGLGIMFVALHRAIEQHETHSDSFVISQALIVSVMCLTSIFPVMLYVCFCLGMVLVAAYDDWRERRFADSAALIRSHWLSAVMLAVLVMIMEPGQTGKTEWHLATKVTGVFTVGKTTNLSLEYLLSFLILGAIAWLAWRRGMVVSRYELAGLLACCLLFIVMPKYLMGVGAADRRLVPAIVTIAAVFVRGPSLDPVRSERAAIALLAGIVAVKLGLLLYLWAPLRELDAAYAQITKAMPANAIVLFVPPVEETRPDAIERARRFARLVSSLQPVPASEAHVFVQHPHLLLRHLAGRNVLPTQVFSNFWVKRIPEFQDLPDPATSQTLADVAAALAWLPPDIVSHVISHIDLDDALAPDISLRKIAEVGTVRLYSAARAGPGLLQWPDG
ncbi:hypothetical protein SAMN05428997_11444 [Bosea sp. CRIB-10]|uniref:hypothetical protein n=1 Tax=Bosea sp. CRIB-10 TaxID=378404 RepID=UPI0008DEB2BC|nr:hypothetical protein [Bosea sp. CRIB-10]SFC93939.1 hypothetical protein SAMN05428997_11444 [Bosea sp. CRIB-10]